MPGRAAAASMAERAELEGLIRHAATDSSLERSGSASPRVLHLEHVQPAIRGRDHRPLRPGTAAGTHQQAAPILRVPQRHSGVDGGSDDRNARFVSLLLGASPAASDRWSGGRRDVRPARDTRAASPEHAAAAR